MGKYSDKWFESQMKTLRPSLAWQVIILLVLVLGAQPVPPFHVELSSPHDDTLLASKQALETLALTRLSGKRFFKIHTGRVDAGLPSCGSTHRNNFFRLSRW